MSLPIDVETGRVAWEPYPFTEPFRLGDGALGDGGAEVPALGDGGAPAPAAVRQENEVVSAAGWTGAGWPSILEPCDEQTLEGAIEAVGGALAWEDALLVAEERRRVSLSRLRKERRRIPRNDREARKLWRRRRRDCAKPWSVAAVVDLATSGVCSQTGNVGAESDLGLATCAFATDEELAARVCANGSCGFV
jgi:hypothetical protein